MNKLEQPLNANERYLHGIAIRLEVLIDMFSSFLDVYANQNNVVTTENIVEEVILENVKEEVIEEIVYATLTKTEIQKILTNKGVDFNSKMTKAELIELLN